MLVKEALHFTKYYDKVLFAISFIIVFWITQPSYAQMPAKTIPKFEFYKLNGQPFSQQQLTKGSKILFLFFDATCPHCQYEVQQFSLHYKDFKNIAFYFVSMDPKQQIEKFMDTYGKEFTGKQNVTILMDKNQEFISKFMPSQYPALYIYNSKHQLLKFWDTPVNVNQVLGVVYSN